MRTLNASPWFLVSLACLTTLACQPVWAQDMLAPPDLPVPVVPVVQMPAAPATPWEGALGANLSFRPEYPGSDKRITKISPALFLRYGRFTITNASGFVTRRADDVVRGLGLDMLQTDRLRVNLALRFDAGRSEGTSDALKGLGDIKPTVRARMTGGWRGDGGLRLGATWSVDAFGRGGGNFGDVSAGRDTRLGPTTTAGVGVALSLAGDRYMQTYYGVNEAQAARSGYPAYTPGAGLRDVTLSANMRTDLGADWLMLGGASVSRLLGPAANSPLTQSRSGWGISVGLARRF